MNMPSFIVVRRSLRPPSDRLFDPGAIMQAPQIVDWDAQKFEEVRPGIFGATVHTPNLTATLYRYRAGSSWETHAHPQDQMTFVVEGALDLVVDGKPVTVTAGELAALPGGVPHSAAGSATSGAVSLNVFTYRERPPAAEGGA
jgi:quercetin dioxygenase-like cupin family protein